MYKTIDVYVEHKSIVYIRFNRPDNDNTINRRLIEEMHSAISDVEDWAKVIIVEGNNRVYSNGGDFAEITGDKELENNQYEPSELFELWYRLYSGPYISIAYIEGKANAGGVGFVAACDIAIAGDAATFSLSEMVFGLFPAMVFPYLQKKIGFHRTNYLTISTKAIDVNQAFLWGLVDVHGSDSRMLLHQHLTRINRFPKAGIVAYKKYVQLLDHDVIRLKNSATEANLNLFTNQENLNRIYRFVEEGIFPWEEI